jgi:AraC-like DNA-binding protein
VAEGQCVSLRALQAVSALSAQLFSAYRVDCSRHRLVQEARRRKPVRKCWTSLLCSADACQHLRESLVIARRHCSLALLRWGFSVRRGKGPTSATVTLCRQNVCSAAMEYLTPSNIELALSVLFAVAGLPKLLGASFEMPPSECRHEF